MDTATSRARRRGGFSTVELAVSLVIFLVVAAAVGLAIARTFGATAVTRSRQAVESSASDQLNKLATVDYTDLLAGRFTVPDPCPASTPGIRGTSCITAAGRDVIVSYQFQDYSAGVGTSPICSSAATPQRVASHSGFIGLCATAVVPGDGEHSLGAEVTRTVNPPSPHYSPDGATIRASLSGNYADLPGRLLWLVKADNPGGAPIASTTVSDSGVAYFSVPDPAGALANSISCTTASPCMLALSIGSSPAIVGQWGLYGRDAYGPTAEVHAAAGKVTDVGAQVAAVPTLVLNLVSVNGHLQGAPTQTGSVCLWLSFATGAGTTAAPLCNTTSAPTISASSYTPAGQPVSYPLPADVAASLTADTPTGVCPAVPGALGWDGRAGGWRAAPVCTSWTWGYPTSLTGPDGTTPMPAHLRLRSAAVDTYTVTWTASAEASPAAGWPGTSSALWTRPRSTLDCVTDSTCAPAPARAPETLDCPGGVCHSVGTRHADIVTPAGGAFLTAAGATSSGTVTVADLGQTGPTYLYLLSGPGAGTFTAGGSPPGPGTLLGSSDGDRVSFPASYTRPAGSTDVYTALMRVCSGPSSDPAGCIGGTDVSLLLASSTPPGRVTVIGTSVAQSTRGDVSATVATIDGHAAAGAPVTFTTTAPGVSFLPATAVTGADGVAHTTVVVGATPAGTYSLAATLAGGYPLSGTSRLTVTSVPTTVTATMPATAQGAISTAAADVTDAAGQPVVGTAVKFSITQDNVIVNSVYPKTSGCITTSSGACTVPIVVSATATTGTYLLEVTSGGVTRTQSFTVSATPAAVTIDGTDSITQGSTAVNFTATLTDGTGQPMPAGTSVGVVGDPGLSVTPASVQVTSGGQLTFGVTAAATARPGEHTVRFTSGGTTLAATITVLSGPTTVTVTPVAVAQFGTATMTVTVTDIAGSPVPNQVIRFTTAEPGMFVDFQQTTNTTGQATATVRAERAAAGPTTITATTGLASAVVAVTVLPTPTAVTVSGVIPQSGTAVLPVAVTDATSAPIPGIAVSLDPQPTGLSVTPASAATNTLGVALMTVTDSGVTRAGTYNATVVAGGLTFLTPIVVTSTPSQVAVAPQLPVLTAGSGQTTITMTVTDIAGDRVPFYPVALPGGASTFGANTTTTAASVTTDATGTFTFTVTATAGAATGTRHGTVTVGTITTDITAYLQSASAQASAAAGPASLWPFDEQVGPSAYDTVGGHHGTGAPARVARANGSRAATITPTTAVTVADPSGDVLPATGDFTVTTSVAADSLGTQAAFALGKGTPAVGTPALTVTACAAGSSQVTVTMSDTSAQASATVALTGAAQCSAWANTWTHLAVVVSRSTHTVTVYVNGVPSGSAQYSGVGGTLTTTAPVTIGAAGAVRMSAAVDTTAIWGTALTAAQVAAASVAANAATT